MSEDFILAAFSSIGFPAAFAGFLLYRVNVTLERLSQSVDKLSGQFETICRMRQNA